MKTRAIVAATLLCVAAIDLRADVADEWTSIAVNTQRDAREKPASAERRLAAVDQAIALALASTRSPATGNGNGNGQVGGQHDLRKAAVAVAAFAVLENLYPEQRENLDASLALALSRISESAAKAEGAALGRRLGEEVLRQRN